MNMRMRMPILNNLLTYFSVGKVEGFQKKHESTIVDQFISFVNANTSEIFLSFLNHIYIQLVFHNV